MKVFDFRRATRKPYGATAGLLSMSTVLGDNPAHHGPLAPAFNICSEKIRAFQVTVNRRFLRPRKSRKEACHGKVRAAEAVSCKIGPAVGEFVVKPIQLRFQLRSTLGCGA